MKSQRYILPVSLVLSLGMHAGILFALVRYSYLLGTGPTKKIIPVVTVPEKKDEEFGLYRGEGNSVDESSLIDPQTSDKSSFEQAYLTRDTPGLLGQASQPPTIPQQLVTPEEQSLPPVKSVDNPLAMALKKRQEQIAVDQTQKQESQSKPTVAERPAGLPAEQKDRDLDLATEKISLEVNAGRVVSRKGRQVKLSRPQINLAGWVDSATLSLPATIKMKVDVDETGSVRYVDILQSCGSSSIDLAYKRAVESSWFEPAKDESGRTIRDKVDLALLLN